MPGEILVIGSGPAGVACARALAARGREVVVVDGGVRLEPERRAIAERLAARGAGGWSAGEAAEFAGSVKPGYGGVPLKLSCGSDFPYREVANQTPIAAERVTAFASLARGGLSNVWGAAVLPYRADDIRDWPLGDDALAPAYRAVFDFMPLAARRDDLEAQFPLHSERVQPLRMSAQADRLLARMSRRRQALAAAGITFGGSRLAVAADPQSGCRHCGLCLHGCPWNLIYNSAGSLGGIRVEGGLVVDRLEELASGVRVHARELAGGAARMLEAERVYVAAGVFQTARIMLNSLPEIRALTLRDSQYFLLPLLGLDSVADPGGERLHTLSQVFVEVADPRVSRYPAHLQIYTYNDLYPRAIRDKLRAAPRLAERVAAIAVRRLMAIQGYLHSHESGTATLRLAGGVLSVARDPDPRPARRVRALARKLARHARGLGFLPILPLLNVGDPGQGAHAGGTFPMRLSPASGESDLQGRPAGLRRVHLVDASVLPSIPATTITLTVMANAHRIGSAVDDA